MRARRVAAVATAACVTAAGALTSAAGAASGPPPPHAVNGAKVQPVASGLTTPTAFAFGAGRVFVADGGNLPTTPGGVFVLRHGKAVRLAGSPPLAFGVTWHHKTLYIASGPNLLAWSGWNGTKFTHQRTIYTAPKGFTAFNGLAFGHNGRLYVGVDVGEANDHGPATAPFQYDILSFRPNGKGRHIFARGMRQPWQMAFPAGSSSPFVTDFGQDKGVARPPDFLLRVKQGDNYGFPKCNWTSAAKCKGFTRPFRFFAPHSDIGGIAIVNRRIYLSEFGFANNHPQIVSLPMKGGKVRPYVTGFAAPVIGLGSHYGYLYFGEVTGQVFRVKAAAPASQPPFTG